MEKPKWGTGTKVWFGIVILANAGSFVWLLSHLWEGIAQGLNAMNIPTSFSVVAKLLPRMLFNMPAIVIMALAMPVVMIGLYIWLAASKKKAAMTAIIIWFVIGVIVALYMKEGANAFSGLVGIIITYNATKKVIHEAEEYAAMQDNSNDEAD